MRYAIVNAGRVDNVVVAKSPEDVHLDEGAELIALGATPAGPGWAVEAGLPIEPAQPKEGQATEPAAE
ncbi:hypothetical protein ACA040_002245 [Xenophilus aerolatus]